MKFVSAQEMHRLHPKTFYAPSKEELSEIKVGTNIKVCIGDERFWVLVTELSGEYIIGTVNNDLVGTKVHGLKYGDRVCVRPDNIYDINEE